jgi:hypothetical protein
MKAADGKLRETDVADTETLLRIIQSIPSPKAEPFKQWLAKVGYERMKEIADPSESIDRARANWQLACEMLRVPFITKLARRNVYIY